MPAAVDEPKRVTNLDQSGDSLNGRIPAVLSALWALRELRRALNQLTDTFPSQLVDLRRLLKRYLKDNSGLTGCVPRDLDDARDNNLARLNLTECAPDAPDTSTTPLPTYSLTVTAGAGGSVDPTGTTTHAEASEVTLTASWNDATHTFAGWGGDCSGTATTCVLTIYANKTATATFTPLARTAVPHRPTPTASAPSTKARPTTTPRSRTSPPTCSSTPTRTAATRSSAVSRSPS